jgi:hypothetical protein
MGATMNDNNTYKVYIKSNTVKGSEDVKTLVEFECDKDRYMYEIEKAIRNGLPFTASDTVYGNDNGGRNYFVSIYIW